MENQIMPKQYIEFKCLHQRIERTDDFFVVGGSQKYLHAKFDLCPDWSGFQQYAVFTGGLKTFRIPIVDSECEVPWEMLLEKRFFVGCEAGQRITSNAAEVKVHPCGAPEETGTPRKPTPTLQSQIGNLGDLKTEAKNNLVDAINEVYDNPGGGSTPGEPGADGGYYIPNVSQVDENTMSVSFAASKEGMADVADQEITLPSGKNGADGKPGADGKDGSPGVDGKNGSDGITPHIGANGNWWIGEEDTGVSAGVTDEQIGGAVEEYMEENPLGGADGLYFDETTGTLYLLQNGQLLGTGVQLPTSGEGPTNNAVLTLENTTGWSAKTISNVHPTCIISVNWSSVDGGVSTGTGTVTVKVENELRYSANIKQGAYTINVIDYLRLGENRVDLTITDFRGNSKSILFIVSMYDPDALVSTKLVERTLTGDYTNDRVTKVGGYAFYGLKLGKLSLPNVTGDIMGSFAGLTADEVELDSVESTDYWMVHNSTIGVLRLPNVTQIRTDEDFRATKVERVVFNRLEDFTVALRGGYTQVVTFDFHKLKSLRSIPNSSLLSNLIIRTPGTVCTLQSAPESTKVKLYVPEALVEQYKVASNWSAMADRIFAIEENLDFCGGE